MLDGGGGDSRSLRAEEEDPKTFETGLNGKELPPGLSRTLAEAEGVRGAEGDMMIFCSDLCGLKARVAKIESGDHRCCYLGQVGSTTLYSFGKQSTLHVISSEMTNETK